MLMCCYMLHVMSKHCGCEVPELSYNLPFTGQDCCRAEMSQSYSELMLSVQWSICQDSCCRAFVTELLRIDVVSAMVHLLLALLPGSLSQPGNEASLLWPQVVYLRSTIATLVLVDHKNLTYLFTG